MGDRKNVKFPLCEITENIFTNSVINVFLFEKIDPSKEGWGDIEIEINAKERKAKHGITTSSTYSGSANYEGGSSVPFGLGLIPTVPAGGSGGTYGDWNTNSSVVTGIKKNAGPAYGPTAPQGDDPKIPCFYCNTPADVG